MGRPGGLSRFLRGGGRLLLILLHSGFVSLIAGLHLYRVLLDAIRVAREFLPGRSLSPDGIEVVRVWVEYEPPGLYDFPVRVNPGERRRYETILINREQYSLHYETCYDARSAQ